MAKALDAGAVDVVAAPIMSTISAVSFEGLSVTTPDGQPATLAIVGPDGSVIEAGPGVMEAAWKAAVKAYRNFLIGSGHLRVMTKPPSA